MEAAGGLRSWARPALALAAAAVLAAWGLWREGHSSGTPADPAPRAALTEPAEAALGPADAGLALAARTTTQPPKAAAAPAATYTREDAVRFAAVAAATHTDPRTLGFLAQIERELRRDPPPEVHALIAEYRRGADRATLLTRVRRDFPRDLTQLRFE